jgi:hypothetical protein
MTKTKYRSSQDSDRAKEAIYRAYDNLPENDQNVIDHECESMRSFIKTRNGNIGTKSMIELMGKIGIWMVKQERKG